MNIAFTKAFEKQISDIRDEKLLKEIGFCINEVRNASSITEIMNVKKLKGYRRHTESRQEITGSALLLKTIL